MPKCSGVIGYSKTEETQPGVWSEKIEETRYIGELVRDNRRISSDSTKVNDNVTVSNNISILSNRYMLENLSRMKYISFAKSKWRISSVELAYPRIVVTMGGLYNE